MNSNLKKIYLIDASPDLTAAWSESFKDDSEVEVVHGDYFQFETDAMVSPANSFGYMDGGLDLAIRYELGETVEELTQTAILEHHHGELPVGCAHIVETDSRKWPYLVCAPTMRTPLDVSDTLNAYLAFRAVFFEVGKFNNSPNAKKIESILCPGLGTGIGRISPTKCAMQMKIAYDQMMKPPKLPGFNEAYKMEHDLKSA